MKRAVEPEVPVLAAKGQILRERLPGAFRRRVVGLIAALHIGEVPQLHGRAITQGVQLVCDTVDLIGNKMQ